MLKLYIAYLIIGLLLSRMIFVVWAPTTGQNGVWSAVALASAVVLFAGASVLALYKPKSAAIIALLTVAGMFPFIWLILRIGLRGFGVPGIITLVGYFVALTMSLIAILRKKLDITKIDKYFLRGLSIAPPAILVLWIVLMVLRFG